MTTTITTNVDEMSTVHDWSRKRSCLACGGASTIPTVVSKAAWRKLNHDLLTTVGVAVVALIVVGVVVVSGVVDRYRHW